MYDLIFHNSLMLLRLAEEEVKSTIGDLGGDTPGPDQTVISVFF